VQRKKKLTSIRQIKAFGKQNCSAPVVQFGQVLGPLLYFAGQPSRLRKLVSTLAKTSSPFRPSSMPGGGQQIDLPMQPVNQTSERVNERRNYPSRASISIDFHFLWARFVIIAWEIIMVNCFYNATNGLQRGVKDFEIFFLEY